jgi:MFS family permease
VNATESLPKPWRFAIVYVLANIGAATFFVPLIGLLLPQRAAMFDDDASARLLSWILLSGAIVASAANIAAGWLSDWAMTRHGSRVPLIALGFAATLGSFMALAIAENATALMAAFLLFQLCFNLFFAPFNALAADHVDDAIKGRVFGMMGLAIPLAQTATVAIVAIDIPGLSLRLAFIAALATLALLPLLFVGRRWAGPSIAPQMIDVGTLNPSSDPDRRRDFVLAWTGRLLVQCAAVAMGSYLFVHIATVAERAGDSGAEERWFADLSLIMLVAGVVVGVVIGQWSDRVSRRCPFLCATALLVGLGCALLAVGENWPSVALGYTIFAVGIAGFQAIDGAVIAQLIGAADRRAARLGLMNLTNTLPSLFVPALALLMGQGGQAVTTWLFAGAACAAAITAALASRIKSIA